MIIAKVEISTVYAKATYREDIPRGIAGAQVEFAFTDPMWDGLEKVVVFQGCCVRDAALQENIAVMPQEVAAAVGVPVRVGVYGCDAQKGIVIPTLWADLGAVKSAADPSGDPAGDPKFIPWVELREDLGNPEELQTQAKDSLVAAINELAKLGVSEAVIRETVEAFLKENDMTAGQDGATFIPAVSADGILSWSNDKGLENPNSVNIKGPKGEKGDTGAVGPQGEKGETGATGPQGIRGATGATGATGPQGAAGTDGVTPELTIGEVTTLSAGSFATASITGTKENPVLNLGIPKGADGSGSGSGGTGADGEDGGYYTPTITQTDENTMMVSFSASKTGMAAVASKTITLPAGPQGEKGETGAAGPQGEQGPQGETGAAGPQGEQGPQGEKGETGATGPQGEKGDTGAAGADGHTPVKGTDYYTAADKTEMVELVLAALPTWEGGSY